jgi:hypothetical protein
VLPHYAIATDPYYSLITFSAGAVMGDRYVPLLHLYLYGILHIGRRGIHPSQKDQTSRNCEDELRQETLG